MIPRICEYLEGCLISNVWRKKAMLCICSCLPCQCVPPCACRRVPILHRSARVGNSKLKTHTHAHSWHYGLFASMPVRMAVSLTTGRHRALIATPCPPLNTRQMDKTAFFPPLSAFMGPLIMLTRHIKIRLSMQCLWYGEEVSWSDAIKRLSAELACNLAACVRTWRGKGKGAAAAPSVCLLSVAPCPSVE